MTSVTSGMNGSYVAGQRTDVEWCRTHDDAQRTIRNAAPGATIRFFTTTDNDPAARGYEIVMERVGMTPLTRASAYSLPVPVLALVGSVRRLADAAMAQRRLDEKGRAYDEKGNTWTR